MTLEAFVERPLSVAAALDRGECRGTYVEAYLVIAGAIRGLASFAWPGTNRDRARFVEAWIRFGTTSHPTAMRISLPLLIESMFARAAAHERDYEQALRAEANARRPEDARRAGDDSMRASADARRTTAQARALQRLRPRVFRPSNSCLAISGDDVDVGEDEVLARCPGLGRRHVRQFSYPVVFYEHVRSQMVHEYQLGHRAAAYPTSTRASAGVSYSNINGKRNILFPVDWLISLTRTIARGIDSTAPDGRLPTPEAWWVNAGPPRPQRRRRGRAQDVGRAT